MEQSSKTGVLLLLFSLGIPAGAEVIYGVTESTNQIFSFDSATPGTLLTLQNITGLSSNESIDKIDVRPANGEIYGVGSSNQIYTIDPMTGVATLVSTSSLATFANAGDIGFDPVTGLLRVVTQSLGSPNNFLINVDTGQTIAEGTVQLAPTDPQGSGIPFFLGVAYSNKVAGATSSSLYMVTTNTGADFVLDIADPNDPNTLHSVGNLETNGNSGGAMDISGVTGMAYFATFINQGDNPFYTVDLQTGNANYVGTISDPRLRNVVAGLSAAEISTTVPEPGTLVPLCLLIGFALLRRSDRRWPIRKSRR